MKGLPLSQKTILPIIDIVHADWYEGMSRDTSLASARGYLPRKYVKLIQYVCKTILLCSITDNKLRVRCPEFHRQLSNLNDATCMESIPPLYHPPFSKDPPPLISQPRPIIDAVSRIISHRTASSSQTQMITREAEEPDEDAAFTRGTPTSPEMLEAAKAAFYKAITEEVPELPQLFYPHLDSRFYEVPFGNRGLSVVQVEIHLKTKLNPFQSIVDIDMTCAPVYPKHILAATLSLKFPNNVVKGISPETEFGPETATTIEKRHALTAAARLGITFSAASASGATTYKSSVQQVATQLTQVQIHGFIRGTDTAQWSLQEDTGEGGKGGLPHKVYMSLELGFKPKLAKCQCLIQVVERSGRTARHLGTQTLHFGN